MLRLAHTGDLHPNAKASFAGKLLMDPGTGKNQSLTDLKRSLEFVARTAIAKETRCHALLLAGDIFDTVAPTMDEVQVILDWIHAVTEYAIPIIVIAGNHDIGTSGIMATALEPLKNRPYVHVFERPGSTIINLDGERFRIFALPYPTRGRLLAHETVAGKSPEEVNALINQGLAAILRGFQTEFEDGVPNILVAHGSVANAKVNDQPRSLAHDILLPVDELDAFMFTALGHIHQRQAVNAAETAWYCGSLMRNGFGEEHEEKGFHLVEIAGQKPTVMFVRNPFAREYCTVDRHLLRSLSEHASFPRSDIVYRFKDQLTPEAYEELKPELDHYASLTPCFQVDVELETEDRTRDAGMSAVMSAEDALARALSGKVDEAELPELLEKHRLLVQAGAA